MSIRRKLAILLDDSTDTFEDGDGVEYDAVRRGLRRVEAADPAPALEFSVADYVDYAIRTLNPAPQEVNNNAIGIPAGLSAIDTDNAGLYEAALVSGLDGIAVKATGLFVINIYTRWAASAVGVRYMMPAIGKKDGSAAAWPKLSGGDLAPVVQPAYAAAFNSGFLGWQLTLPLEAGQGICVPTVGQTSGGALNLTACFLMLQLLAQLS